MNPDLSARPEPLSDPGPTDESSTVADLKRWVLDFSRERDWERFHDPKSLGVALASEVGELLEPLRYRETGEIRDYLAQPGPRREFGHELADCLWLVLRLAEVLEIDLASTLREKLDLAAVKYPVALAYGRADKYTAYQTEEAPPTD